MRLLLLKRLVLLYLSGLHNSQNILLTFTDMLQKNPVLILNTPDFAEDFDSLICLACTMANAPIFTTARSWFSTIMMLPKDPKD